MSELTSSAELAALRWAWETSGRVLTQTTTPFPWLQKGKEDGGDALANRLFGYLMFAYFLAFRLSRFCALTLARIWVG